MVFKPFSNIFHHFNFVEEVRQNIYENFRNTLGKFVITVFVELLNDPMHLLRKEFPFRQRQSQLKKTA